jgi:cell division topological specificity factor
MNFFDRFKGAESRTARTAKERLRLVLIHDRADLPPAKLEAIKDELVALLSRYIEIDPSLVHVSLTKERNQQRLVADIQLAPERARRREAR